MVFSGSGAQPSGAHRRVQAGISGGRLAPAGAGNPDATGLHGSDRYPTNAGAGPRLPSPGCRSDRPATSASRLLAGIALAGLLSGCSSTSSMNPINWWHSLQGGKIAEDRPPPPGADDPNPNLASVPPRPEPPDRDAMRRLTEALVGDRTHAQYTAEAAPLPDPSSPSASPNLFGAGTLPPPPAAPPPGETPLSATLPAASAPPAPPSPPAAAPAPATPPLPAPRRPVESQPLEAPPPVAEVSPPAPAAPPTAPDAAPPVAAADPAARAPAPTAAPAARAAAPTEAPAAQAAAPTEAPAPGAVPADTTPLPDLPSAPPPRADAAPSPPPPPAAPLPPAPAPAGAVSIAFPPNASTLSPTAAAEVKRFLTGRVGQPIIVTGYGDATSPDPSTQAAAMALGLARAQAVTNALTAAGVPRTAISIGAEAAGRGASLRMLQ